MARKNSCVRKKNRRLDRREKEGGRMKSPTNHSIPRIQVQNLVMPDGQCFFPNRSKGKASFATKEKAQKALDQARLQRARTGSAHVEKRFYPCPEGGCGGYHLTSRSEFDEKAWKSRPAR